MGEAKRDHLHTQLAAEHSRLHIVGSWPDSPRKEALLRAIRSSIVQLSRNDSSSFDCMICRPGKIIPLLSTGRLTTKSGKIAA